MNEIIELGTITLSERAVVSDPGYDRTVWCMNNNVQVKSGEYLSFAIKSDEDKFGDRVACIICIRSQSFTDLKKALRKNWSVVDTTIGVDSGQAGIFDNSVYPEGTDVGEFGEPDTFYGECCEITLGDQSCGRLKNGKGIVSSSGFGDGSYELKALKEGDASIALMIDFGLTSKRKIMEALVARPS